MKKHSEPENLISPSAHLMQGVYVGLGVLIEDDVVIGPNAVILGETEGNVMAATIMEGAVIGANATIVSGVCIGVHAHVAPGTVVTRSVPPFAIVEGNPARIIGYVETHRGEVKQQQKNDLIVAPNIKPTKIPGVTQHQFRLVPDLRGSLVVGEFEREIPFTPKRYFIVFDVPSEETRGEHAHIHCEQFLVVIKGSVNIVADDGDVREEFILNHPRVGLYLPPMTWGIQYRYTSDAVLLVFASDYYDAADYVRDYSDFQRIAKQQRSDV